MDATAISVDSEPGYVITTSLLAVGTVTRSVVEYDQKNSQSLMSVSEVLQSRVLEM
jgi:hypothetical protein